jgi:hypothetical protein
LGNGRSTGTQRNGEIEKKKEKMADDDAESFEG